MAVRCLKQCCKCVLLPVEADITGKCVKLTVEVVFEDMLAFAMYQLAIRPYLYIAGSK